MEHLPSQLNSSGHHKIRQRHWIREKGAYYGAAMYWFQVFMPLPQSFGFYKFFTTSLPFGLLLVASQQVFPIFQHVTIHGLPFRQFQLTTRRASFG